MPRKLAGRVYWGYSRSPLVKDSSMGPACAPSTPGILRTTASMTTMDASSPEVST